MVGRFLCLFTVLFSGQCLAADERFSCAVDTPALKLSIDTAFNPDQGHGLIHFRGVWTIDDAKLPDTLQTVRLDSEALTHSWLDDRRLMLHVYRQTSGEKPFASLDLTIITERTDGDAKFYRGTYVMTQQSSPTRTGSARSAVDRKGQIACIKS